MLPLAPQGDLHRLPPALAAAGPPNAGEHELPGRALHPGHPRRRRRRRRADRLGAAAPTRRSRRSRIPRWWSSGRSCISSSRREFQERAARLGKIYAITFESRFERAAGARARRGRHGRLQHLLRDPVVRQAGAPGAAHRAAPGAAAARRARRRSSGWCACCADDGVRAPRRWPSACARCRTGRRRRSMPIPDLLGGLERIARARGTLARRAASAQRGCRASPERRAGTSMPPRPPATRGRRQGLSAAVGDLHRAGDPGARAPRAARSLIVSLRHPTDPGVHELHRQIAAPVLYLPEYLHHEPARVAAAWRGCGAGRAIGRRAGCGSRPAPRPEPQPRAPLRPGAGAGGRTAGGRRAAVRPLPAHAASVTRYAARLRGLTGALSAHAKDVWTIPGLGEAREARRLPVADRLQRDNAEHLRALAPRPRSQLTYHGLDADALPGAGPAPGPTAAIRRARCGCWASRG